MNLLVISLACVNSFDMGVPNVGSTEVLEAIVTLMELELVVKTDNMSLEAWGIAKHFLTKDAFVLKYFVMNHFDVVSQISW